MAFRGLQAESATQGQAHEAIARDLDALVVEPFAEWASQHKNRVNESKKAIVDGWLRAYENASYDVC